MSYLNNEMMNTCTETIKDRMISCLRRYYPILIMLAISLWPLYLYLLTNNTIFVSSRLNHYPPLRYNAIATMLDGHLPLWNPYIFTGMPLLGDAISNPFDILGVVLMFFKPVVGFSLLTSFQLFLSGLFMYIYLRKALHLQRLSSLFGGIMNIFSPVLLFGGGVCLDFIDPVGSFLWLPLLMCLLNSALEKGGYRSYLYATIAGIVLALALFGGSGNIVMFMTSFLVFMAILHRTSMRKKFAVIAVLVVVSVLITSVQVLPTIDAVNDGHRSLLWQPSQYDLTGLDVYSMIFAFLPFPEPLMLIINKASSIDFTYKGYFIGVFSAFLLVCAFFIKSEGCKIRNLKIAAVTMFMLMVGIYYLPLRGVLISMSSIFKGMHLGYIYFLIYFCAIGLMACTFDVLVYNENKS